MEYIAEHFNSINDLLRACETRKPNKVFAGGALKSSLGGAEWTKTASYADAVELAKTGYTDPLAEIKRGVVANAQGNAIQKTRVKNDIVGYAPHVPNAIIGIPQSMINKELSVKKSKIVSIVYDVTGAGDVKTDTYIKAGIAALSIVNSLESSGYRVALKVAFKHSEGYKQMTLATVMLKDWRQPLDLKKMAFPFCHPSMQRRIGFRWMETQPKITDSYFNGGYGGNCSRMYSYAKLNDILHKNKLIGDNEKFINIKVCKENNFDPQKIAAAVGITE